MVSPGGHLASGPLPTLDPTGVADTELNETLRRSRARVANEKENVAAMMSFILNDTFVQRLFPFI